MRRGGVFAAPESGRKPSGPRAYPRGRESQGSGRSVGISGDLRDSVTGARHPPPGQAPREYAGAANKERLLSLLFPVRRALEAGGWLKTMVDFGGDFSSAAMGATGGVAAFAGRAGARRGSVADLAELGCRPPRSERASWRFSGNALANAGVSLEAPVSTRTARTAHWCLNPFYTWPVKGEGRWAGSRKVFSCWMKIDEPPLNTIASPYPPKEAEKVDFFR